MTLLSTIKSKEKARDAADRRASLNLSAVRTRT